MKSDNTTNDIMSILPRYCEGKASEEDCRLVENWIQESKDNQRIVKQILALYLAADTINVMKKVDTEKALSIVKGRAKNLRIRTWWKWSLRIAAIFILPLTIFIYVQYHNKNIESIQMLVAKASAGMTASIILPDSTQVILNSKSSLIYPSSFEGSKIRKVELRGEAYFKVTKDVHKHFVISIPHQTQIEVLGTTFNVEAYDNSPEVSTTLVEGKVYFRYKSQNIMRNVIMKPGEKAVYNSSRQSVSVYNTNCTTETAWKDGKIILNNTPFNETIHILEKYYDVNFIIKRPHFDDSFTGIFTDQSLQHVLEYFELTSNIKWKFINEKDTLGRKKEIEIY